MKFFVSTAVALLAVLLSGCGGSGDAADGLPAATSLNDYAPATVDRLMESCLSGGETVSACTCLLDAYRRKLDEATLSSDETARAGVRRSNAARCGLQAAPAVLAGPPTAASQSSANANANAAPPQVGRASMPAATRAVAPNSPDACLQDKLAAAEKTGSVPIEAFERFQRECGL